MLCTRRPVKRTGELVRSKYVLMAERYFCLFVFRFFKKV